LNAELKLEAARIGVEPITKLFKEYGVTGISNLPVEKYGEFLTAIKAMG
jgi:hypothetical protein